MQIKKTAALLAMLLALTGCSGIKQPSSEEASVVLPEPPAAETRQILGDSSMVENREVTLYSTAENSLILTNARHSIQVAQNENLIANVIAELFENAGSAPVETQLIDYEFGSGIATVNLAIAAGVNRTDQDYLLMCASIANTLLGLEEVEAVNVLTGSRSDPLCSLPLGVFVQPQDNIAAAYAQIHSESELFTGNLGSTISRNVLLYFPSMDGKYLLPEIRELNFTDEQDYIPVVLGALRDGPLMRSCCFGAVPGSIEPTAENTGITVSSAGERIAELQFDTVLENYLAFSGIEPWQFYGSVVLTVCSFVPEIDAVRMTIGGVPVQECSVNGARLRFSDGLMRRSDFSSFIGSSARLHFADENGRLACTDYPISRAGASSAAELLKVMISADTAGLGGYTSVFPDEVSEADVLGVRVEDRTAVVNLSAGFYSKCQSLSPDAERLMIYAIVNTLSSLEHIGSVSFLIEGRQIESLAHDIYLKTALMPDPGLADTIAPELFFSE